MRNISQLIAATLLLATQVNVPFNGDIAAADQASAKSAGSLEVRLNTNTPAVFEIVGQKKPDYDAEVLAPLAAKSDARARAAANAAERARLAALKAQARVAVQVVRATPPQGDVKQLAFSILSSRGMSDQWGAMDFIIARESGWNLYAQNPSGACGLPQAYPCSKIVWGDAASQINWFISYCTGRYGSVNGAYSHWLSYRSY